jgi:FkbM family methyltransferase
MNRAQRCRYGVMLYNVNDPVIGRSLAAYGEWAQAEMDLLEGLIGRGDWVVDVGAYVGTHTLFFAQRVAPEGRVIAMEPQRLIFQTLCANVALNSLANVNAHLAAVGRAPGTIEVPVPDYHRGENFSALSFRHEGEVSDSGLREEVPLITIDALDLDTCRLIKADVEGMEIEVMHNITEALPELEELVARFPRDTTLRKGIEKLRRK